jgi:hypothetical protein
MRLTTHTVAVPPVREIQRQAARAEDNGLTLRGAGPFRRVAGGLVPCVVGPLGCTCAIARVGGEWCQHRSMLAVALGQVPPPDRRTRPPRPRRSHRERRGWIPKPLPKPPIVTRFRLADGRPTPMDRLRDRNRAAWLAVEGGS